jgi:hypothetical protein
MKDVLQKLAQVADSLDQKGYSKQSDAIDAVIKRIAGETMGSGALNDTEMASIMGQGREQTVVNPNDLVPVLPTIRGRLVLKTKMKEAPYLGFFSTESVKEAVREGKVDMQVALEGLHVMLEHVGYDMITNNFDATINSILVVKMLPQYANKDPEPYGVPKSMWSKIKDTFL